MIGDQAEPGLGCVSIANEKTEQKERYQTDSEPMQILEQDIQEKLNMVRASSQGPIPQDIQHS